MASMAMLNNQMVKRLTTGGSPISGRLHDGLPHCSAVRPATGPFLDGSCHQLSH